jgi:outer membrane receptor protein involved in Fe transport
MSQVSRQRSVAAVVAAAVIPVCLASVPVHAQSKAAADANDAVLEEVVVTARKREESLQDVPIAVTALSGDTIEERNINNLSDLALFTPGFSYTTAFGRNNNERPAVRGQSTILGAPVAAFFVDGVYLTGSVAQTELDNVERIEVIKGPQSALYGRGTYQAAINYVTKRPTNDFEGKANLTYGEHDNLEAGVSLSGPLIEGKLYYVLGAKHYEYGGEYRNTITGEDLGAEQSQSGTVKLLWTPTENLELSWLTTFQTDDDGHAAILFQGSGFNNCLPFDPVNRPRGRGYYCGEVVDISRLESAARTDLIPANLVGVQRDRIRSSLNVKLEFGDGYEFTSISGYSDEDQFNGIDVSYAGYDAQAQFFATIAMGVATQNAPTAATTNLARQFASPGSFWRMTGEDREDFSQELRFSSPIDRRFRWSFGGYYFRGNDDNVRDDKVYPNPVVVLPNGTSTLTTRTIDNRGVFGSMEFDFNDKWTVTAEARRAKDVLTATNYAFPPNGTTRSSITSFDGTFNSFTPRFTLRWKPTDNITVYANKADGTRPGGFQAGATATLLTQLGREDEIRYREEEVRTYEAGIKMNLFDRRASLNVSLYYNDLFDQQLTTNLVNPATGQANSLISNLGETEIYGIELELAAKLTDRWSSSVGITTIDAEITDGLNTDQADLFSPRGAALFRPYVAATNPTGCVTPTTVNAPAGRLTCQQLRDLDNAEYGSVEGKRPPRAPKLQGFLTTKYNGTLGNGWGWYVGGDYSYESSKFAQVHNLLETGDRGYVNLRAGLETDTWTLQLWGKNVTDDDTPLDILRYIDTRGQTSQQLLIQGVPISRGFAITPPRQRQFGLSASFKF